MILDFHVHAAFKNDGTRYTAREIVDAMDSAGVEMSLILGNDQGDMGYKREWTTPIKDPYQRKPNGVAPPFLPSASNFEDEEVAEYCAQIPERLIGSTSVHASRYRPELKVERAIKEFGLKAVKIYPHSGFFPNDDRLRGVYKTASELNVPVIFHTGIKAQRHQYLKFNNPVYVDDVATDFPSLKVVMCHGGYPYAKEFITVAYSNPNVWVDISFMNYIEKTFQERNYTERIIKLLRELIGAERIVWGTEGPFMNIPLFGMHNPDYYKEMQDVLVNRFDFLSVQEKRGILGENARKLLGI